MKQELIHSQQGQTATELLLVISVVVIAVVGAAFLFVPGFVSGVNSLSVDVDRLLTTHESPGTIEDVQVDSALGPMNESATQPTILPLADDGLLTDVSDSLDPAKATFLGGLALMLAGAAWYERNRGIEMANEKKVELWNAYAAAGGTEQGLNRAYSLLDSHGGDINAAAETMRTGVRSAVYTPSGDAPPRTQVVI